MAVERGGRKISLVLLAYLFLLCLSGKQLMDSSPPPSCYPCGLNRTRGLSLSFSVFSAAWVCGAEHEGRTHTHTHTPPSSSQAVLCQWRSISSSWSVTKQGGSSGKVTILWGGGRGAMVTVVDFEHVRLKRARIPVGHHDGLKRQNKA